MKSIFIVVLFIIMSCTSVFAEATFEQIQGLIKIQNYPAAIHGLEIIIQNHPKSAKAYYTMSQAEAGVGDLVKAKKALDIATGIDPELKFASSSNVENLKNAIQPQTKKIEAIESHTGRNAFILLLLVGGIGAGFYFLFKKRDTLGKENIRQDWPKPPNVKEDEHKNLVRPTFNSYDVSKATHYVLPPRNRRLLSNGYQTPYVTPRNTTTIINNGSNNNGPGFLSGMVAGVVADELLSSKHHETEKVYVEREYVTKETPVSIEEKQSSSSWDEPREEKKSSSWDNDSSNSSSSWDSGSSSSSSSWDSSSDSSSSSSWD